MTDRNPIHDDLELYAVGAMSSRELLEFDEHLRACGLCQSRAPRLFQTLAELIPDSPAPTHLWAKIVSAIER